MYQVHATGDGEGHEIESEAPSLYGGPPNTKVVKCEAALSRNSGSSNSSNGSSIGIRDTGGGGVTFTSRDRSRHATCVATLSISAFRNCGISTTSINKFVRDAAPEKPISVCF